MPMTTDDIFPKEPPTRESLIRLLDADEDQALFARSAQVKRQHVGNTVYLRGLIEFSNRCAKDCYYCGIRRSNAAVQRYCLSQADVLHAVQTAYDNGYGSIAIQSGENTSSAFVRKTDALLKAAKRMTNGRIGITLSCGEQSETTYRRWFESGADRYLLRIETSSEKLYRMLHPNDRRHSFARRLLALEHLRKTGYQVGTGVMIGLPFQTTAHLADDLLFMQQCDIDMCGMGPYIEHAQTPLYAHRAQLLPPSRRLSLSYRMVALLRILMKDINIAATTALQALEKEGREKAIRVGANVLMPNITPHTYRDDYFLYDNKPLATRSHEDELRHLQQRLHAIGHDIGFFRQGNSAHYRAKQQRST